VPGANIKNYFDATVFGGIIYLFPGLPDENLDFSHVHTIDMEGRTPMKPFPTRQDPQHGYPGVRKQCALDTFQVLMFVLAYLRGEVARREQGKLFVVGGQLDDAQRGTFRYGDAWALDLRSLQWERLPTQLPLLIVEPRVHINDASGLAFVWGDCDKQSGCYTNRRHFHVQRCAFPAALPAAQAQAGFAAAPPGYAPPPPYPS